MNILEKKINTMGISDLKWICKELSIKCNSSTKSQIIKLLLKPLTKTYKFSYLPMSVQNYLAPLQTKKIISFNQMKSEFKKEARKSNKNITYYYTGNAN